ncbi:hypothetical protein HPY42_01425 [Coprothermobacteraceae bacterium]|nr:hypothetical protein [Coprothermobacteraceae bacterium]
MRTTVQANARGKSVVHDIVGFPIRFESRWLHALSRDGFDAYIPRRFSGRTWLVSSIDGEPTLSLYVIDKKPTYWIRNLERLESLHLSEEPTAELELPDLQFEQFQKGRFFTLAVPLSQIAPLLGNRTWWVESADGLERVIPASEIEQWLLTKDKSLMNLGKRAGCWIKNVTRVCGDRRYIKL